MAPFDTTAHAPGRGAHRFGAADHYDLAISYSSVDESLAALIARSVRGWGRFPWQRSRYSVFRDAWDLSIDLNLRAALRRRFEVSSTFLLVATRSARSSGWVDEEVGFWIEKAGVGRRDLLDDLIIVADPETVGFVPEQGRYDPETSILPPTLVDHLNRHVESLPVKILPLEQFSKSAGDRREAIGLIVAKVIGANPERVLRREARRRLMGFGVTTLLLLAGVVGLVMYQFSGLRLDQAMVDSIDKPAGRDFSDKNILDADFVNDFSRAGFLGARIEDVRFARAAGSDAVFDSARLRNVHFTNVDAPGLSFTCPADSRPGPCEGAELRSVRFDRESILQHANFNFAELRDVSFVEVDLRSASFIGARGYGIVFEDVDLRGVNMAQAELEISRLERICWDDLTTFPAGLDEPANLGAACR